jgi:hypothetical protein
MISMPNHFDRLLISRFRPDDEFLAPWIGDNYLYPATIIQVVKNKLKFQYKIEFNEDGVEQKVNESDVEEEEEKKNLKRKSNAKSHRIQKKSKQNSSSYQFGKI